MARTNVTRTNVNRVPIYGTPNQISGLDLWLRASDIPNAVDSQAVGTWNDLSGNSRDAIQATGTKQPLYKTNIINGRSSVRFDGVDDFIVTNYTVNSLNGTVFMVFSNFVTNAGGPYLFRSNAGNRTRMGAASNSQILNYEKGNSSAQNVGSITTTTSSSHLARFVWRTTNAVPRADLFDKGTQRIYDFNVTSGFGSNGSYISLGAIDNSGGQPAAVDILEFIVYNKSLEPNEVFAVENYINDRYGFAVKYERTQVTRIPV